jgi:hypothetical protein
VRFIASRGPSSLILDLSAVEELNFSSRFALKIGRRKAAIPARMSRFVVAPQQKVYEFCRSVEALRASTAAPISVVREIGVAFARFGVARADFCPA